MLVVTRRAGRSRYRFRAPRRTAPTCNGNPNTARTPAPIAGGVKAGQRTAAGSARSGSSTTRLLRWASTHGPSPSVYCRSSIKVLTSSVVHTDPCGTSRDMSMIPAPDTQATRALTSHSWAAEVLWPANSARARRSLSPATPCLRAAGQTSRAVARCLVASCRERGHRCT